MYTGLGSSFGSFAHITLKVWLHLLYFGLLTTIVQTGTSLRVKGGAVNNDPRMFQAKWIFSHPSPNPLTMTITHESWESK